MRRGIYRLVQFLFFNKIKFVNIQIKYICKKIVLRLKEVQGGKGAGFVVSWPIFKVKGLN